jgi:hypothetical protein
VSLGALPDRENGVKADETGAWQLGETALDLPLCKFCGTRHRLGYCPEFGQDQPSAAVPQTAPVKAAAPRVAYPPAQPSPNSDHEKASPPTRKRGRPFEADRARTLKATQPWVSQGISESTWYRRQKN